MVQPWLTQLLEIVLRCPDKKQHSGRKGLFPLAIPDHKSNAGRTQGRTSKAGLLGMPSRVTSIRSQRSSPEAMAHWPACALLDFFIQFRTLDMVLLIVGWVLSSQSRQSHRPF